MLSVDHLQASLPFHEFLNRFGTAADKTRWSEQLAKVSWTENQLDRLRSFTRRMNLIVLAGAWCGDCASQCPIPESMSQVNPCVQVRYLDRDSHVEAAKELSINGGQRVPVVVVFSEDGFEVCRYGERTHTQYRKLIGPLLSETISPLPDDWEAENRADWLREIERAQWILRLSPRLRRLHKD